MIEPGKKDRFFRRIWVAAVIVVGTLGVLGGALLYKSNAANNPFPKEIRQGTSFGLYYPSKVPEGWMIDQESFTTTEGVVFYKVVDQSDDAKYVVINLQPQPNNFDFDRYHKDNLKSTIQFMAPLGQATIGKTSRDWLVGSLPADDAWVLATSNSPQVNASQLRLILSNLKK